LDASGDPTEGRETKDGGFNPSKLLLGESDPGVLMTSAFTTPRTCRTVPLLGVMIMGASFRKSLEKLALDMYEFLDDTPETPECCDAG
jgi:hypothetical protein